MSRWLYGEAVKTGARRPWWRPAELHFPGGAEFEIGHVGSGWILRIEPGFRFDLSAPWWTLPLLPLKAMYRAAGGHDLTRSDPVWSLWFGNLLFVDMMKADGVEEPVLTLAWWAVRTNTNRPNP